MSPGQNPKKLNKTLTFGLGNPSGWDPRKKEPVELSDDQRKAVYTGLRATSRLLAQMINILNARTYVKEIMEVPEELAEGFKPNYKPIVKALEELGYDDVSDISGATLSQTYALGVKPDFTGDHRKQLLVSGERQLPTHKINGSHPVYGRGKETLLYKSEEKFHLAVQIFSTSWKNKHDLPSGWISFPLNIKPRDKKAVSELERTISGEWELKNSRILRNPRQKGNRWLGQIVVSFVPQPHKVLSSEVIMGVDLGVSVPACIHIRKAGKPLSWAMFVGRGKDMLNTRNTIKSDIVRIVKALRSKDSPLDGPARESATLKLKKLRKRERRVMKTASQVVAARIADTALRHGAGVWQMEMLSENIKDEQPWLKRNWAPGMVVDAVRWQAEQVGAELVFINPSYTSQRCSACGCITSANRPKKHKGASYFKCVRCEHEENADKNAARNISTLDIERIIEEERKKAPNGAVS
jgi:putative transposase